MYYKHLLAKRAENPDDPAAGQTLFGHTKYVVQAMEKLNDRLAKQLQVLTEGEIDFDAWRHCSLAAAWLHDLGKANDHFQAMIRNPKFRQGARHEALGIVVVDELLADWLQGFWDRYPPWLQAAVYFAIAGHHLKFPDRQPRSSLKILFLGSHPDLRHCLACGNGHTHAASQKHTLADLVLSGKIRHSPCRHHP